MSVDVRNAVMPRLIAELGAITLVPPTQSGPPPVSPIPADRIYHTSRSTTAARPHAWWRAENSVAGPNPSLVNQFEAFLQFDGFCRNRTEADAIERAVMRALNTTVDQHGTATNIRYRWNTTNRPTEEENNVRLAMVFSALYFEEAVL